MFSDAATACLTAGLALYSGKELREGLGRFAFTMAQVLSNNGSGADLNEGVGLRRIFFYPVDDDAKTTNWFGTDVPDTHQVTEWSF